MDRGTRDVRLAPQATRTLVPRAPGVAPLPSGHALETQIRPHRIFCVTRLLDLRILWFFDRACALLLCSLSPDHREDVRPRVPQLSIFAHVPAGLAWLWRPGQRIGRIGGLLALSLRTGGPPAAQAASVQPPSRGRNAAVLRRAGEFRVPPAHSLLENARAMGCLAG